MHYICVFPSGKTDFLLYTIPSTGIDKGNKLCNKLSGMELSLHPGCVMV